MRLHHQLHNRRQNFKDLTRLYIKNLTFIQRLNINKKKYLAYLCLKLFVSTYLIIVIVIESVSPHRNLSVALSLPSDSNHQEKDKNYGTQCHNYDKSETKWCHVEFDWSSFVNRRSLVEIKSSKIWFLNNFLHRLVLARSTKRIFVIKERDKSSSCEFFRRLTSKFKEKNLLRFVIV